MFISAVSCIANVGLYHVYLRYQPTYGVYDFDPYSLIAALVIVVIILSALVGWLWRAKGDNDAKR